MREIKFRAFNADTKQMIYPTKEGWYNKLYAGNTGVWQDIQLGSLIYHTPENVSYQQFTGLQDKNKKDIYESDRIKDNDMTGIVKWIGCGFMIEWEADCYSDLLGWEDYKRGVLSDGSSYEIIGNIYENKK